MREGVEGLTPLGAQRDEATVAKASEVARDRGLRQSDARNQVHETVLAVRQVLEDRETGGISQASPVDA